VGLLRWKVALSTTGSCSWDIIMWLDWSGSQKIACKIIWARMSLSIWVGICHWHSPDSNPQVPLDGCCCFHVLVKDYSVLSLTFFFFNREEIIIRLIILMLIYFCISKIFMQKSNLFFLLQINIFFDIFRLFWCSNAKNNF